MQCHILRHLSGHWIKKINSKWGYKGHILQTLPVLLFYYIVYHYNFGSVCDLISLSCFTHITWWNYLIECWLGVHFFRGVRVEVRRYYHSYHCIVPAVKNAVAEDDNSIVFIRNISTKDNLLNNLFANCGFISKPCLYTWRYMPQRFPILLS